MSETEDAARLVDLCRRGGPWLAALRSAEADFASIADGRSWGVDVEMYGVCSTGIGILEDGLVVRVPPGGPVDAVIAGEPQRVAAFLSGELSAEEAIVEGILTISPETPVAVIEQFRRVASRCLRTLLAGPAAIVVWSKRTAVRVQVWRTTARLDVGDTFERLSPGLVAATLLTLGTGVVTSAAVTIGEEGARMERQLMVAHRSAPAAAEEVKSSSPVAAAPRRPFAQPPTASRERDDPSSSANQATFGGMTAAAETPLGPTIETPDGSRHTVSVGTYGGYASVGINCTTKTGGLVCSTLRSLPPTG